MNKLESNTLINGTNRNIGDFWEWAYSDILSNRNRAIFAEFLVGNALGAINSPRLEWDGYDLIYRERKIEVKSSAYLQSWKQTKLSLIRYDVDTKKSWDARTNTYSQVKSRIADYYVFCLFRTKDASKANILDVTQWEFYIVETSILNQNFASQKSIGLGALNNLSHPILYDEIRVAIDHLIGV